jgi:hypothetical protein
MKKRFGLIGSLTAFSEDIPKNKPNHVGVFGKTIRRVEL